MALITTEVPLKMQEEYEYWWRHWKQIQEDPTMAWTSSQDTTTTPEPNATAALSEDSTDEDSN